MKSHRESLNYSVSAPGKVILFGEHSVVYKKAAVSTSISRRLIVNVCELQENKICIKFPQVNLEVESSLDTFQKIVKEKCPYQNVNSELSLENPDIIDHNVYIESLKCNLVSLGVNLNGSDHKTEAALIGFLFVMRGMCQMVNFNLLPFSLEVTSELEVGAGTGSSAAFAVAISGALLHYVKYIDNSIEKKLSLSKLQFNDNLVIKSYSSKSGFSLEEVRIINKWAFCVEKIMHGRPSGIDNTTCTFGSVVVTSTEDSNPDVLSFSFLDNVPKISILLISTGISRNTSNLVLKVRQLRERNQAAVDAILNAMNTIAIEAFKVLEVLSFGDNAEYYKALEGLMTLNHGLLRTLGVSHDSLERIVSVTQSYGLSSKLTGAGGGGYAISLVPPHFSKIQLEKLSKELGSTFTITEINISEEGVRLDKM